MLTSQQVNALMAQQNAQFAMMQQQGSMGYAPAMGVSQYPPSFSYGYNPNAGNQNLATAAASGVFGGIGAAGAGLGVAGTGLGLATMFSSSPSLALAAGALDFTGMSAAFGAAGMAGGLGSAAGMATFGAVALPAAAIGAGVTTAGYRFTEGGRSQAAVNRLYGNEMFANPMAFSGRGFSTGQMLQLGRATRAIDESSPYISGADSRAVGEMFREMGVARGMQNVDLISSKLKEFGKVAETVAKQLGTSIRDVQSTLEQNRRAGFFSAQEISGNVAQMRMAEGMGMGREAFMGMQLGAVATTRGMGLTGQAGARASRAIATSILGGMQTAGVTSEELKDLTNAGSLEEAVAALSTSQTSRFANILSTQPIGRALLAGVGTTRNGRFTGGIDVGTLERVASGELSLEEIQNMASRNLSTEAGGMSFMANQKKLVSATLESEIAGDALVGLARRIVKDEYGGNEDALTLVMERLGIAQEQEQELFKKLYEDRARNRSSLRTRLMREIETERMQADRRQNYTISGRFAQLSGTIRDAFAPFEEAGADVFANLTSLTERTEARLLGFQPVTVSEQTLQSAAGAFARGEGAMPGDTAANKNLILRQLAQSGNLAAGDELMIGNPSTRARLDEIAKSLQTDRFTMERLQASKADIYGKTSGAQDVFTSVGNRLSASGLTAGMSEGDKRKAQAYIVSKLGAQGEVLAEQNLATLQIGDRASGASVEELRKQALGKLATGGDILRAASGLLGRAVMGPSSLENLEFGVGTELLSKLDSEEQLRKFDQIVKDTPPSELPSELSKAFGVEGLDSEAVKAVIDRVDKVTGSNAGGRLLGAGKGTEKIFSAAKDFQKALRIEASAKLSESVASNITDTGFLKELEAAGMGDEAKALQRAVAGGGGREELTRLITRAREQKFRPGESMQGQQLAAAAGVQERLLRSDRELSVREYYDKFIAKEGAFSGITAEDFAKSESIKQLGPTLSLEEQKTLATQLSTQVGAMGLAYNAASTTPADDKEALSKVTRTLDQTVTAQEKNLEATGILLNEVKASRSPAGMAVQYVTNALGE